MESTPVYRIHPAIGIARLGDSPDEFYIAPDRPGAKPIDCDQRGNPKLSPDGTEELTVTRFKDAEGRVKRQDRRRRQCRHAGRHHLAGLSGQ
jgi:hypothetical protein